VFGCAGGCLGAFFTHSGPEILEERDVFPIIDDLVATRHFVILKGEQLGRRVIECGRRSSGTGACQDAEGARTPARRRGRSQP
jgi:hypothetical protein